VHELVDGDQSSRRDPATTPRPRPLRWVGYAFGAGLPERYHEWVLRDVTARTWWLRHLARTSLQLAVPIAAVCVFTPGPPWIRIAMVAAGVLLAMIFSLAYMVETNEHRLVKAGYAAGTGERLRSQAAITAQRDGNARRRERAAQRRAKRGR
jgi:hypothetical protein